MFKMFLIDETKFILDNPIDKISQIFPDTLQLDSSPDSAARHNGQEAPDYRQPEQVQPPPAGQVAAFLLSILSLFTLELLQQSSYIILYFKELSGGEGVRGVEIFILPLAGADKICLCLYFQYFQYFVFSIIHNALI